MTAIRERCVEEIPVHDYYRGLQKAGIEYGPLFQALKELRYSGSEALGRLQLPDLLFHEKGKYVLHPVCIDSCMQLLGAVIPEKEKSETWLPVGLKTLRINLPVDTSQPETSLWCHAMIHPFHETGSPVLAASLQIFDDHGNVIVSVEGLTERKANREVLLPPAAKQPDQDENGTRQSEIIQKIANAAFHEREGILLLYIRDLAAEIMGLGSGRNILVDRPVMEQGLDSLMSVELRNSIGNSLNAELPVSLFFDYPTLRKAAEFILHEVLAFGKSPEKNNSPGYGDTALSADSVLNEIELLL
ncbi:MAG: polyketide synthase dehydratase domain-containing protein [Dissulfurispiraceae bacterium]